MGAPGISFFADKTTGFYRTGAGQFVWVSQGVAQGTFGTSGLTVGGTLNVTGLTTLGALTLTGTFTTTNLTVTGTISSGTAGQSIVLNYPLSSTYGGSLYSVGTGVTGSATNAQTIAAVVPFGYTYGAGQLLGFDPGFTNTSDLTLQPPNTLTASFSAHHVMKRVGGTLATLSGGEVQNGLWAIGIDDGAEFQLLNPAPPSLVTVATNTTLSKSNHLGLIEISANVTLTLPAPYPGGQITIVQTGGTAFTLAGGGGNILGPTAAVGAASIVVPARSGNAIYQATSDTSNWFVGASDAERLPDAEHPNHYRNRFRHLHSHGRLYFCNCRDVAPRARVAEAGQAGPKGDLGAPRHSERGLRLAAVTEL